MRGRRCVSRPCGLPFTQGRQLGIECITPVPLIGGRNLENVTITGRGVLTTNNAEWLDLMGRRKPRPADPGRVRRQLGEAAATAGVEEARAAEELYQQAAPELRPSFVRTMDSQNVLIEGMHIAGSPMWTIHLLYSDNVVVRDVIIETYPGVHTDGIAVDSSRNVRISNCYIDTGDDGIVIKSGKDADGRRVNRPSENISITNCTVHRAHGAVTMGSETSGGIRNVVASNITCHGTQMGVRIKSRRGARRRGGEHPLRQLDDGQRRPGDQRHKLLLMEGEIRTAGEPVSERTPVFRNIAISNMTINHARVAVNIEGLPEMPISGLRIGDVIASPTTGIKAYNTDGLELHQVQVNAESGPAFLIRDSKELELDGVSARKTAAGMPVIRLDHCPGAMVRQSRAFAGTGTFLSVGPGELKHLILEGNSLGGARKAVEESSKNYPMNPEKPTEGEKNW